MALSPKLIKRFGATPVYTRPDAKVDIVFVHGLNGEPGKTWTAKNGVFWPTHLLPASLVDAPANIIVYGYNADVTSRKGSNPSESFVYQHAQDLVASLTAHRGDNGTSKNAIIWVCHSLGGIIVKKALLYSNDLRDPKLESSRSIFVSTFGIIFLGTPHTGSNLASWARVLQAMVGVVPTVILDSEPVLLNTLMRDNGALQETNNHFLDIYQRFRIHMARENHKTNLKGTLAYVVDSKSATPQLPGVTYYGIEATHTEMARFESAKSHGYSIIANAIREWVVDAPPVIQVRWQVEEDENEARALQTMNEVRSKLGTSPPKSSASTPLVGGPSLSGPEGPVGRHRHNQSSQTLPFISPGFPEERPSLPRAMYIYPYRIRPNSYFKGREPELEKLHSLLTSRSRRARGTSAVSIQSLPGGGKSHLARQYVFLHQNDYRGGIFWIPSRSVQEMEEAFWEIAKTKTLRELDNQTRKMDLMDPRKIVDAVRSWFESFDDWLIVFDGIHFDTAGVADFIPNMVDTSVIYTSTDRAVGGDHRFDNPVLLELGPLSGREAQELLLEEMQKTEPFSPSDLGQALEAVELMGRLPLMIHVAAQYLKATREPLDKYIRSFADRRKASTLDAYKAVREQLQRRGETASLNLMYLLCFFGQRVPVEMVGLGIKGLDNRTPVRTTDAAHRKSLNNTFTVLIAFALLGRNESDDNSSASSRSSQRSASDRIDTLRIHSIVQAFFIDTLAEEKEVPFWLERAVGLFCSSYDVADARIQRDPKIGLPDDYRRYAIHGQKLLSHVERFGKKSTTLAESKKSLESRLSRIDSEIEALTKVISGSIISGRSDLVPKSIFEISSSMSDSDSTKSSVENTPSDHTVPRRNTFMHGGYMHADTGIDLMDSPVEMRYEPDMYHTVANQMPYPSYQTFPIPSSLDEELSRTSTPRPPRQPKIIWPDRPKHRAVTRMEQHRYSDRSGAMRNTDDQPLDARIIVDHDHDPRLAISQDNAPGQISPISPPSETSAGAHSGAHSNPDQPGYFERMDAKSILSRLHRAPVRSRTDASAKNGNTSPIWSFLPRAFGKSPSPSSSPLKKEDNISPQSAPSNATYAADAANTPSRTGSPGSLLSGWIKPASAGNSPQMGNVSQLSGSPPRASGVGIGDGVGVGVGGFHDYEERLPHSELPIVVNQSSSLFPQPLPRGESAPPFHISRVNQHFSNEELAVLPPDGPPEDPTSVAMPFFPESLHPHGYSSQPMSRNVSGNRPIASSDPVSRNSSPGSLVAPFAVPRRRRPSHVETEPSPRIAPLGISGPCQNWEERHTHHAHAHAPLASSIPASRWSPDPGRGPTNPPSVSVGGEDMDRSGSGGIITGDGNLIQFGTPGRRRDASAGAGPSNQDRDLAGIGLGIMEE